MLHRAGVKYFLCCCRNFTTVLLVCRKFLQRNTLQVNHQLDAFWCLILRVLLYQMAVLFLHNLVLMLLHWSTRFACFAPHHFTQNHARMHGQQNIKKKYAIYTENEFARSWQFYRTTLTTKIENLLCEFHHALDLAVHLLQTYRTMHHNVCSLVFSSLLTLKYSPVKNVSNQRCQIQWHLYILCQFSFLL